MALLEIEGLGKTYGEGDGATHAIGDLSFELAEREFVCVVGPSGCGKTTLLKCMSGLLAPSAGEVRLRDRAAAGDGARVPGVQPLAAAVDVGARQRRPPAAAQEARQGRAGSARRGVR